MSADDKVNIDRWKAIEYEQVSEDWRHRDVLTFRSPSNFAPANLSQMAQCSSEGNLEIPTGILQPRKNNEGKLASPLTSLQIADQRQGEGCSSATPCSGILESPLR